MRRILTFQRTPCLQHRRVPESRHPPLRLPHFSIISIIKCSVISIRQKETSNESEMEPCHARELRSSQLACVLCKRVEFNKPCDAEMTTWIAPEPICTFSGKSG